MDSNSTGNGCTIRFVLEISKKIGKQRDEEARPKTSRTRNVFITDAQND